MNRKHLLFYHKPDWTPTIQVLNQIDKSWKISTMRLCSKAMLRRFETLMKSIGFNSLDEGVEDCNSFQQLQSSYTASIFN